MYYDMLVGLFLRIELFLIFNEVKNRSGSRLGKFVMSAVVNLMPIVVSNSSLTSCSSITSLLQAGVRHLEYVEWHTQDLR